VFVRLLTLLVGGGRVLLGLVVLALAMMVRRLAVMMRRVVVVGGSVVMVLVSRVFLGCHSSLPPLVRLGGLSTAERAKARRKNFVFRSDQLPCAPGGRRNSPTEPKGKAAAVAAGRGGWAAPPARRQRQFLGHPARSVPTFCRGLLHLQDVGV